MSQSRRQDLAAAAALLLLVGALFHMLPEGHWRGDDPAILLHALRSPGLSAFVDPTTWQQLSPNNLTPWLTLSFKLDLALGGLLSRVFYIHQLVSTTFVTLAAYALGRQWLPPAWAALGPVLCLTGAPTGAVVELLTTRHYLEGLLFTLLALLGFVRGARDGRWPWVVAGAVAYALACTAKEVYVPLVVILPWLPLPPASHGSRLARPQAVRRRALLLLPYAVVAGLYVPWRLHMLGDAVGGYEQGQGLFSTDALAAWAVALGRMGPWMLGAGWPLLLALMGSAAVLLVYRRGARPLALVIVVLACVLLPLLPLALNPGLTGPDRYLFLPWWVLGAGVVAALRAVAVVAMPDELRRLLVGLPLGIVLATTAAVQAHEAAGLRAAVHRESEALGRFLVNADPRSAFVPPPNALANYWYVVSVCEIQRLRGASCPQAVIPGWPPEPGITRLFVYDAALGTMAEATERLDDERRRAATLDTTRPLSVRLRLEGGFAHWQLGPYADGQYFVVSPEIGRYPLPASGRLRTTIDDARFQIHHVSTVGWTTASPTLRVRRGAPVEWAR